MSSTRKDSRVGDLFWGGDRKTTADLTFSSSESSERKRRSLKMKNDLKRRLERIESFHKKITAFAQRESDKNNREFNFMVNMSDSLYLDSINGINTDWFYFK